MQHDFSCELNNLAYLHVKLKLISISSDTETSSDTKT